MSNYVFRTDLSIEECTERFQASVDHGIPWLREYHPEWEFVGNIRGRKLWLKCRRMSLSQWLTIRARVNKRFFIGKFEEHADGTYIYGSFRFPRHTQIGAILAGLIWFFMVVVILGAFMSNPVVSRDGIIILGFLALFGLFFGAMLPIAYIERKDEAYTITFIQRTFDANLIEPVPTNEFVV